MIEAVTITYVYGTMSYNFYVITDDSTGEELFKSFSDEEATFDIARVLQSVGCTVNTKRMTFGKYNKSQKKR